MQILKESKFSLKVKVQFPDGRTIIVKMQKHGNGAIKSLATVENVTGRSPLTCIPNSNWRG